LFSGDARVTDILFGTYPWAFDCPGGGERQLVAWRKHLEAQGTRTGLYDPWIPVAESWDIFHFFSAMPGSYQLCEYMRGKGLKLVITPNLWVTQATKWDYPHDDIKRLFAIADRVIVNAQIEAETLAAVYELPLERFRVVYNGIEAEYLEPVDPAPFLETFGLERGGYLLNVGNVEHRKNQLRFLEALKDTPDLTLVTVGHARDADYLQACQDMGGAQFRFLGPLEYGSDLLRAAMSGARAFVMPSTLETPSIAALEAAAIGCPLLITGEGSTKEYFVDEAIYIEPLDVQSLRYGVQEVMGRTRGSETMRARISERFTWAGTAGTLANVYDELNREARHG
jgi:glycosyltransferase involved in cell wall biosynthesis